MFTNILVPLDGSALAEQALGTASMIARATKASVDLVTVVEPLPFGGFDDAPWSETEWNARQKYVESTAAELTSGSGVPATGTIMRGPATEKICEREAAIHADLVVMTSHGRSGMSRAWLGSIADGTIRHSDVPVLVLPPEHEALHPSKVKRSFSHVLVPVDGSSLSSEIVSHAVTLATSFGADITLLRIVTPLPLASAFAPGMPIAYTPYMTDDAATDELAKVVEAELAELARSVGAGCKVAVKSAVVVSDHIAQAIIDFAKAHDIDLIAMSTHGRGASRLLLGSVADKVLRASGLPLLMHRPSEVQATRPLVSESAMCEQLPALGMTS